MDFEFQAVDYDRERFLEATLPSFPKRSGVYKIFDTRGKLIVLDKSSDLHDRMERFFGERSEMLRDLDLREITSGIDPHPDCLYFQMHTCSRPCNNDIDRRGYLHDVEDAIDFVQGHDHAIEERLLDQMNVLAADTQFESAELVRRKLDKIRKARD